MRALDRAGRMWSGVVVSAILMIGACCLMASPATARIVIDKVTGQKFGMVAVPHLVAALNAAQPLHRLAPSPTATCDPTVDSSCASPLVSHGGPVQHAEKVILFFWDPNQFASAPGYVSGLQTWLNGVAAGDFSTGNTSGSPVGNSLSVTEQYYDTSGPGGAKNFVSYAVSNGGTVMDSDPFPPSGCTNTYTDPVSNNQVTTPVCLTADQLLAELGSYVAAHNLPRGIDTEYFIMTPPGVGTCDDSTSTGCSNAQYCGWHTAVGTNPSTQLLLADIPWVSGTGNCDVNRTLGLPNLYSSGIDSVVGVFTHELAETMTDPDENAWFGSGGGSDEIGDKCAYQYVTGLPAAQFSGLPQAAGGAYYNTTLGANNYLLQMEYSDQAGGCTQWNTDTQPAATISAPASVASGVPATISLANVVDPVGIAYVTWYFGDGAAALVAGTAAVRHTYTVGGARTVTAVVTDNHGNELKLTKAVTVTSAPSNTVTAHPPSTVKVRARYSIGLSGHAVGTKTLYMFVGYRACAATPAGEHARANGAIWTVQGSFSRTSAHWKSPRAGQAHVCAYLVLSTEPKNPRAGVVAHDFVTFRVHR